MATENYYSIHAGETIDDAVSLLSDGALPLVNGGTGATTAEGVLANLGVTALASELNILDGVTASTSELNILDGVTASASELNILDGVTVTSNELNAISGITENIQVQLDSKVPGSRTVNGKYLSENIVLSAADVGATTFKTITLSIATSDWSSNSASVSCNIATASNTLIVAPAPSSYAMWGNCKIRASAQAIGVITFSCDTVPTSAVSVNVVALG